MLRWNKSDSHIINTVLIIKLIEHLQFYPEISFYQPFSHHSFTILLILTLFLSLYLVIIYPSIWYADCWSISRKDASNHRYDWLFGQSSLRKVSFFTPRNLSHLCPHQTQKGNGSQLKIQKVSHQQRVFRSYQGQVRQQLRRFYRKKNKTNVFFHHKIAREIYKNKT